MTPTVQRCDFEAGIRTTVLLVEDDVLVRMTLAESLREATCEVMEAASSDEALRLLACAPAPDILVTDVKLPGAMDGVELAARARQIEPGLKIIVTSGHAAPGEVRDVADAFLAKPFHLHQLLGEVRALALAAA